MSVMLKQLGLLMISMGSAIAVAQPAAQAPVKPAPQAAVAPVSVKPAVAPTQPQMRVLLKAAREARISSPMSGRIISIPFKMGQSFRRGDVLIAFDCVHQEAELASATALLEKMEKNLATKKNLSALSAVPAVEVELAAADVAQARAQVSRAKASVADCRVLAPYHGNVVKVVANHAESVGPGSPLIEIVEAGNLHVEALAPSSWLTWLATGKKFTIHVDEIGREVEAVVSAVGARVDPVSQTIPISGRIVKEVPGLRAGMSGNARFASP